MPHDKVKGRPIANEAESADFRVPLAMLTFGLSEVANAVVYTSYWRCQRCHKRTKC